MLGQWESFIDLYIWRHIDNQCSSSTQAQGYLLEAMLALSVQSS